MTSELVTASLLASLAVVMFGLGTTLQPRDFRRVLAEPKAAVVALTVQLFLLPVLCFVLVTAFGLAPTLAVGMMVLVAAPGGTVANLFSHLAGGDVALNVTLTAINSLLSLVLLPVVVNLSIAHFLGAGADIGLQSVKVLQVVALVLAPVLAGMWVRHRYQHFTGRIRRALNIVSAATLVLVIAAALISNVQVVLDNFAAVGLVALVLSAASLAVGYGIPRLLRVGRKQAIASSFEIGLHNATLAIAVAAGVLQSQEIAIAPAIYGIVMYAPAAMCCYLFARR
ncbi:bile acid:sodium symporter family protein [Pseudonocardia sp. TRM90224]|uniref:bile acid:sodium symporter family protein n=1 Tax=Pseudonocardia sp. TRM90224 TaxID=2812678 RepID=UPI001E47C491|nr:bile acid:sodium symporter [Pseudonocardia sp. TRM90224]